MTNGERPVPVFSIDQNCHSLWDVLPKLHALSAHGYAVRHFVEDVDVAYTAIGSAGAAGDVRLARERYYRSGGADWGAALFYSDFLGRLPVDLREWEPLIGMKVSALARRLERTVDDLYDQFSPGDNWQLIGPGSLDQGWHRVIGDLSVAEIEPFLRALMEMAEADMCRAFPAEESQERLSQWFARERRRLDDMLRRRADGSLVEVYRDWLGAWPPPSSGADVQVDLTSNLLVCGADRHRTALLGLFVRDYQQAAGLYNESIAETSSALRPLRTREGELPFFAVTEFDGHLARTGAFLDEHEIRIGDRTFPVSADGDVPVCELLDAGIRCLAGKALLLVLQVRLGPGGGPLALPDQGSLYMPTATRLAAKLAAAGLLPAELHPVLRVRFYLLDRMRSLETPVRLPHHLVDAFGAEEIPARTLAENWRDVATEARRRLESFRQEAGRRRGQQASCRDLVERIADLDARRRTLAAAPKGRKSPEAAGEIRSVLKQIKPLEIELLDRTLGRIDTDYQTSHVDYWDSRGALLPWSVALGGETFYKELISRARVYQEPTSGRQEP